MEDKIERIQIRLNPKASMLDAMLCAGLRSCTLTNNALVRVLLANYFSAQSGGLGLGTEDQAIIAEGHPRAARPATDAKPEKAGTQKATKKTGGSKTNETDKPTRADSGVAPATPENTGDDTTQKEIVWNKDNPPPCLDMSDFDPRDM